MNRYISYLIFFTVISTELNAQSSTFEGESRATNIIENSLNIIEEQITDFRNQSAELAILGAEYCAKNVDKAVLDVVLNMIYHAWVAIDMYQFGPIEQQSAALAVNFWPDKKGFVAKHISQFDNLDEVEKSTPEGARQLSVAAQGLPTLIALMKAERCPEIEGVSANIALHGDEIYEGWFGKDGWAEFMRNAGENNPVYFTPQEVVNEIYTAVDFGLQRAKMRLEQPLGSFHNPLPSRAEADELGISAELVMTQINAVEKLVIAALVLNVTDLGKFAEHIRRIREGIDKIPTPLSEAVMMPNDRIKIEITMQRIDGLLAFMAQDIAPKLGVSTSFSPADGD